MEELELVFFLIIIGVVVFVLLKVTAPPELFAVRITNGEPKAMGTVTQAFLDRIRELAADHGIGTGRVWGVAGPGGRIRLGFSRSFPQAARQQLRNWWVESGWSAGKRRV